MFEVSVVLCSRNEPGLISLVEKIEFYLTGYQYEIIIVDDSDGKEFEVQRSLLSIYPNVKLIHRFPHERVNRLAGALIVGINQVSGNYVLMMDSDGQHPAKVLPQMIQMLELGYDWVHPSRYIEDASFKGLGSPFRIFCSWSLRQIPRFLFWNKIFRFTDPLSGFYGFRRECVNISSIEPPEDWRMQLELLLFCSNAKSVIQIPFAFLERQEGHSKAGLGEGIKYFTFMYRRARRYYFRRSIKVFDLVSRALFLRANNID